MRIVLIIAFKYYLWMLLFEYYWNNNRSSRPEVFCEKVVPRNFPKFTGKHVCQSLFFNKVVGLRPGTLLKKRLWHRCFPVNFVEFLRIPFRAPFLTEHLWWLFYNNTSYFCAYYPVWNIMTVKAYMKNRN